MELCNMRSQDIVISDGRRDPTRPLAYWPSPAEMMIQFDWLECPRPATATFTKDESVNVERANARARGKPRGSVSVTKQANID